MHYHIEFGRSGRAALCLEGVKYMQKDAGEPAIRDLLGDYTTLYCHVYAARGRRDRKQRSASAI